MGVTERDGKWPLTIHTFFFFVCEISLADEHS